MIPTSMFGSGIRKPLPQFQGRGESCQFVFVAGRLQQRVRRRILILKLFSMKGGTNEQVQPPGVLSQDSSANIRTS